MVLFLHVVCMPRPKEIAFPLPPTPNAPFGLCMSALLKKVSLREVVTKASAEERLESFQGQAGNGKGERERG